MADAAMIPDMTTVVDEHGVIMLRPETETVPEHDTHARLVDTIFLGLASRFHDRDDVAVHRRLAWFPDADDTRIRLDPDVMVVFGRPHLPRKSYKAWAEDHVPPTVLIEVWSEDDTDAGYRHRLARARQYGVTEVVLVAPSAPGGCRISHLVADGDGPLRTLATSTRADDPIDIATLGIHMAGGDDLVVGDEWGSWPDPSDLVDQTRRARARADRLAEALRAAGIDPDTV